MTMYNFIIGVHALAIVLVFGELIYVTRQKPSAMQNHIILLLVSTLMMFIGYFIELKADTAEIAYMGRMISYIGKPFILLYTFLLICDFYNVGLNSIFFYILNCASAFVTLSALTNHWTHLFIVDYSFDKANILAPFATTHGSLYYVYSVSLVIFFVMSIIVVVREYFIHKTPESRAYSSYFCLALMSGLLGYTLFATGITNGYDASLFGVIGSIASLSVLFFRYNIFDVLTLAKDRSLELSPTATIILDENNKITYSNAAGKELLKGIVTIEQLKSIQEDTSRFSHDHDVYEIVKRNVDVHGQKANYSYEISNITDSVNYQNRLEKEVKTRADRIESIQRKVVSSFASIVEARSLETGGHIVRTSEYVRMTAEELVKDGIYLDELGDELQRYLADVAPLHDIGKISVSDQILMKPGKLNTEEFDKMKKHAEVGAKVIESSMRGIESDDYVAIAMDVARFHHERWDGKGYPTGLAKEKIPLSARIMAVADCYDALVSERCYKPPLTKEEALQIIQEESGTHFDPNVVEAFVRAIQKAEE